jgi:hypothetical protein
MVEEKAASAYSCGCDAKTSPAGTGCCQTNDAKNTRIEPWVKGAIATPAGAIPRIASELCFTDILGSWKARWNIGRMDYKVAPGIYGVGNPDATAPVLVTANYKMTFDRLRSQLAGRDLWILVLDTKGINVWCAAGKGPLGLWS